MAVSAAERNRRKRERKKKAKLQQQQQEEEEASAAHQTHQVNQESNAMAVEIDYVPEEIPTDGSTGVIANDELLSVMKKYQETVTAALEETTTTHDNDQDSPTKNTTLHNDQDDTSSVNHHHNTTLLSKRQIRTKLRPSVAALKKRVARPDLVEAHDPTAMDPDFLIQLKAVNGTVPVPRTYTTIVIVCIVSSLCVSHHDDVCVLLLFLFVEHWGRKRKYLQGKRGFEKPPFQLPDFIVQTGITELRDTLNEKEAGQSVKQKNRARVAPKMGAMDVDYRTLHDAFFKYQTKPTNLTTMGNLYYEGKELHVDASQKQLGAPLSDKLRQALGMTSDTAPPPWLWNMQRYGPPPTFPRDARIPGLTAPLPSPECQYGFHPGGWGKPPLDPYGRPLYGGNPLDPPGTTNKNNSSTTNNHKANVVETLVTSDGKMLQKNALWGALPTGIVEDDDEDEASSSSSEEEESENDDMQDSDEEEAEDAATTDEGVASTILPPPPPVMNLRKDAGEETPAPPPRALYQVLDEQQASQQQQQPAAVFQSQVTYQVPGGAESVLQKAAPAAKPKTDEEDEDDDLGKNFKF